MMKQNNDIEDIRRRLRNMHFETEAQRAKAASEYHKALLDQGIPEDIVETEIENWLEITWTNNDWKEHYEVDSEDDIAEELMDEYDDDFDDGIELIKSSLRESSSDRINPYPITSSPSFIQAGVSTHFTR